MRLGVFMGLALAALGMDAEAAVRVYRPADPSEVVLRIHRSNGGQGARSSAADNAADDPLQRARSLQYAHEFRDAERLLDEILERNPRDREARLMRAQIRLHLREPQQSLRDCVTLTPLVDMLTAATCIAQARAAMGDVDRAHELVVTALRSQRGSDAVRSWSAGVAAELASRRGDARAAGDWYREAYRLDPGNHYARMTYADWLLSEGRHDEAFEVASDRTSAARIEGPSNRHRRRFTHPMRVAQ